MRIETLQLQNVRALEHFETVFQPQFNLIVGKNATGKTTILKMIARILSQWTPTPKALLQRYDPHEEIRNGGSDPYKELRGPCLVAVSGQGPEGDTFSGTHTLPRQKKDALLSTLTQRRDNWLRGVNDHASQPMPLLVLFSPYRDPPKTRRPKPKIQGPQTRLSGYNDAFDLWADIRKVTNWIRTYELSALQEQREFPALEAVREAIVRCLPDCTGIRYMPRYDEVMIKRTDGSYEPVWRLSDGYRTIAALVGEMAWRAVTLNPGGIAGRPSQIKGVALIDELDIHLHPAWQRLVVEHLRSTFPNVQFIATTHSPFIVQSMHRDEVINLDPQDSMDYWREGIEDISVEAMGAGDDSVPRSKIYREFEALADRYMALVQRLDPASPQVEEVRQELDQLQEKLSNNPAVAAVLRAQRLAREAVR